MSPQVATAAILVVLAVAVSLLIWWKSPKFRAVFPDMQSGPFWWSLTSVGFFLLLSPAINIGRLLWANRFGEWSWTMGPALLFAAAMVVDLIVPATRRSTGAYIRWIVRPDLRPTP